MRLAVLVSLALAFAASAAAQPAAGPAPEPARSPQFEAARQEMRDACSAEFRSLCPGFRGRLAFLCLMEAEPAKLSKGCRAGLVKLGQASAAEAAPAGGTTPR